VKCDITYKNNVFQGTERPRWHSQKITRIVSFESRSYYATYLLAPRPVVG